MEKKLGIISVTYNNYEILKEFLRSLEKQTDQQFQIYLTDNSENKQDVEPKLPNLTLINSENKGYAAGVNTGLKKALGDGCILFMVINDDTYFSPDFISKVKKSFESSPSSIIGGKIYYAPGYEYHKERYQKNDLGKVVWYAGGEIDWSHMLARHHGVDKVDKGQFGETREVGFVTGCLTLFDKSVLDEVGFWDESFFLYYEDADFCIRAKKKGVKIFYDPSLVIWHKVSQSTDGSGSALHQKYQNRNRLRLGLRYAPLKTKLHLLKNYLI